MLAAAVDWAGQFNILLEVHVRSGGDATRGLHCHGLGPSSVSLPGQGGNLEGRQCYHGGAGDDRIAYLNLVSGIWLKSGNIIGSHIWIASIEPQRLTVVLVESLLNIPLIELDTELNCSLTDRVPGLDVDLVGSDHAILFVVSWRLPVDHHCAGVERFGSNLSRLSGHWSSIKLVSEISELSSQLFHHYCQIQIVFTWSNQLNRMALEILKTIGIFQVNSQHLLH